MGCLECGEGAGSVHGLLEEEDRGAESAGSVLAWGKKTKSFKVN
jgi:hypothetical protein